MIKVIKPFAGGGGGGGDSDFTIVKKLDAPESYPGNVGTVRVTSCKVPLEGGKLYRIWVDAEGGATRVGGNILGAHIFLSYSGTATRSLQTRQYASGSMAYGSGLTGVGPIGDGSSGEDITMIGYSFSVGTQRRIGVIYAGIHTDTAGDLALNIYASNVGDNASDEIFIDGVVMYVQEV